MEKIEGPKWAWQGEEKGEGRWKWSYRRRTTVKGVQWSCCCTCLSNGLRLDKVSKIPPAIALKGDLMLFREVFLTSSFLSLEFNSFQITNSRRWYNFVSFSVQTVFPKWGGKTWNWAALHIVQSFQSKLFTAGDAAKAHCSVITLILSQIQFNRARRGNIWSIIAI